jgi:hypothetical protein
VQARFPGERTKVSGASATYVRTGDSGGQATFHFCPTCGATVYWLNGGDPDLMAIAVGAFADPTFPAPKITVYGVRQHPWLSIAGAEEQFD